MLTLPWNWTPILMLHEVVPDGTDPVPLYGITQAGLRAILEDFSARGYSSGTLDDVVRGLSPRASGASTKKHRGKRLVLTFDDGTGDFLKYALPVLQEFKFSATL